MFLAVASVQTNYFVDTQPDMHMQGGPWDRLRALHSGSSRFWTAEPGAILVQLLISEKGTRRAQEDQDLPSASQRRLNVHSQPLESLCQWGKGHIPLRVCITGRACGHPGAMQVALQRSWYRWLIQYSEVQLILWCNKRLRAVSLRALWQRGSACKL